MPNSRKGRPPNPNNKHHVTVSLTIPLKLLQEIEEKCEGKNRSQKIVNSLMKSLEKQATHCGDRRGEATSLIPPRRR